MGARPFCDQCQFSLVDLARRHRTRHASGYCEHRRGAVLVTLDRNGLHVGTTAVEAPPEHAERARRRLERRAVGWFARWYTPTATRRTAGGAP